MQKPESQGRNPHSEAFGLAFGALMARLTAACDARTDATADPSERVRLRHRVAAEYAEQAEALIAQHQVSEVLAEYVRHVVREGFDVAFDSMDPTPAASASRGAARATTTWVIAPPAQDGVYALKPALADGGIELARFERSEETWLVERWGVQGAVDWRELVGAGWSRSTAGTEIAGS